MFSKEKASVKLVNSRKAYDRIVRLKMESDAVFRYIPFDKLQQVFCSVGVGFDDEKKKMYYCIASVDIIEKALEKLIELQIEPNDYTKAGKLFQKYCDGELPLEHQATCWQKDVSSTKYVIPSGSVIHCIMTSNMFQNNYTISELTLQNKDKALAIFIGFAAYIPTMDIEISKYLLLPHEAVVVYSPFDYEKYNAKMGTELKPGETNMEIGCREVITAVVGVTLLMYTEPNELNMTDKINARIKSICSTLGIWCPHMTAPLSFWNAMFQVIRDCPLLKKTICEALRELRKNCDKFWSNFAGHVIDLSKKKEMTQYECVSLFVNSEQITDAHRHPKIVREMRIFKKREKELREFCKREGYDIWYYRVYCPNGKLSIVNDLVSLLGVAKIFCSIYCGDYWKGMKTRKDADMTFWDPLVRNTRRWERRYSNADFEVSIGSGIDFKKLLESDGYHLESSDESGCVYAKNM